MMGEGGATLYCIKKMLRTEFGINLPTNQNQTLETLEVLVSRTHFACLLFPSGNDDEIT